MSQDLKENEEIPSVMKTLVSTKVVENIRNSKRHFGIVVDEIDKVVGIQKSSIQPPHSLFGDINIKYIYGVVESENNLYVLLDIDRIFGHRTSEEEKELAEIEAKLNDADRSEKPE